MAASAEINDRSTVVPEIGKFSTARCVWACHLAALGTRTSPMESCSMRYPAGEVSLMFGRYSTARPEAQPDVKVDPVARVTLVSRVRVGEGTHPDPGGGGPLGTVAASIVAAGLWWSWAATQSGCGHQVAANGTATDPASAESSLRIQAQELAGQIQAEGVQLDQLAAAYEATQLRSQRLAGQLKVLQARMVHTDAEVTTARANLKEQALRAYLAGGAPIVSQLPGRPGLDKSLTVGYAEIVSGGQQRAVNAYRWLWPYRRRSRNS